jgi:hypothetical protein
MESNGIYNFKSESGSAAATATALIAIPEAAKQSPRRVARLWCAACAQLAWMVTPEEAAEIVDKHSFANCRSVESRSEALGNAHRLKTSEGATLICYDSLFPAIF